MNDRLEIASRLMAALFDFTGEPKGHAEPTPPHMALIWADALIAEESRTRPPAADAPAPDELRAVAEELMMLVELDLYDMEPTRYDTYKDHLVKMGWRGRGDMMSFVLDRHDAALARARAMGLGGGK